MRTAKVSVGRAMNEIRMVLCPGREWVGIRPSVYMRDLFDSGLTLG